MSIRLLLIADDAQHSVHVRALLDASGMAYQLACIDHTLFRSAPPASLLADHDLLLAWLDFAPAAEGAPAQAFLSALPMGLPPLVVLAENGDERSAVQALRAGAADYVPAAQLDAPVLRQTLTTATAGRRVPVATAMPASAPVIVPGLPRELVPRYTLLQKLGESMRATVYLAASDALGRNVALKVSRYTDSGSGQFAAEYAVIGALRHPAVVDIYDYGIHDGREYLAMEYFPCGDLRTRLTNPLTMLQAQTYLRRIASSLGVLHAAGVVHRDVKPANIMLRENAQVVLIDFGLARAGSESLEATATGVLRGSPYYMSPEQAQGAVADERSDLYSLGVILHEMLTGQRPFLGATAIEVLRKHVEDDVPRLATELAGWQGLLDRLLAKDPAQRPSSVQAVLADPALQVAA